MKSWGDLEDEDRKWKTGEWQSLPPAPGSVEYVLDRAFIRRALAVIAMLIGALLCWLSWRFA